MNAEHERRETPETRPDRRLPWLERPHAGVTLILGLALLFWLCFVLAGTFSPPEERIAGAEPVACYAWIRSLAFDRDLDFENEYRALTFGDEATEGRFINPDGPRTPSGRLPNAASIGPGLLWAPFLALGHAAARLARLPADGFSQPYHTAVFLANIVYGTAGALLTCAALRAWWGKWASALAAVAAWAASPALYYTYAREAMPHAAAFFASALFIFVWSHLRRRAAWWAWAGMGAALGLAALVQWQCAAFIVVPAVDALWRARRAGLARLLVCAVAALLVFSPQLLAWHALFETPMPSMGGEESMAWLAPAFFRVLFSAREGLFTWTPLMAVGLLGLCLWPRDDRQAWVAIVAAVLIQIYLAACARDTGASFGARHLVASVPFYAMGLAALFSRYQAARPRWMALAVTLCVVWNTLFVMQFAGLLDPLYLNEALYALAEEQQVPVTALTTMNRLPDGTPFELEEFAQSHQFPRDATPSLRQFVPDKLTVVLVLGRQVLRSVVPDLLTE